ncbi:zinc-binding dehydrogenase [Escherichia coli]|nr:zinc-binding dehydrogenase [Escherichia coli]
MAIQLARTLSRVNIIGTASRQESVRAVRGFGAHYVLDHSCALAPQVASLAGLPPITRIFSTYTTPSAWENMAEIIAPQGRIGLIDDPEPLDLRLIKFKSVSVHWEAMFTRPMHATADMSKQHDILNKLSCMLDSGKLKPPLLAEYGRLNAKALRRAHEDMENKNVNGKIVFSGL